MGDTQENGVTEMVQAMTLKYHPQRQKTPWACVGTGYGTLSGKAQ